MKKIILLSLLLSFGATMAHSQYELYFNSHRDYEVRYIVDTCNLAVAYNYEYVIDTGRVIKYYEPMILEVGDNLNRFYSQNSDISDSLYYFQEEIKHKGHEDGRKGIGWFGRYQSTTYADIYTYPKEGERLNSTRITPIRNIGIKKLLRI